MAAAAAAAAAGHLCSFSQFLSPPIRFYIREAHAKKEMYTQFGRRTIIHNSKIESLARQAHGRVWVLSRRQSRRDENKTSRVNYFNIFVVVGRRAYAREEIQNTHRRVCGCGRGRGSGGGGGCVFAKYVRSLNGASHSNHCTGCVQLLMGMRNFIQLQL